MKLMTEGNIYKNFLWFSIPMVLSGLLSQAASLIDTVIAGKFLGESGLAAIGSTALFMTFCNAFFIGYANGAAILIARCFAHKDKSQLKSYVFTFIFTLTAIFFVVGVLLVSLSRQVLIYLNVDQSIFDEAQKYFVIVMGCVFLNTFQYCASSVLNSFGITVYSFVAQLTSAVINVTGNVLSVVVFDFGVTGIAVSTVISNLVVSVIFFVKLSRVFKELGEGKIGFSKEYIQKSVGYGVPCMVQQLSLYVVGVVVSPMINVMGVAATAGYSVVEKLYSVCSSIFTNSNRALVNYSAQCMGAHEYHNIKKGIKAALIQNTALTLPAVLIMTIFGEAVCSLFFINKDAGGMQYSLFFASHFLPFIVFAIFNNVFHGLYRGIKSMKYLIVSTIIGSAVRITASLILIPIYQMTGAFIAMVTAWILETLFSTVIYFSGLWIPKDKKELFLKRAD